MSLRDSSNFCPEPFVSFKHPRMQSFHSNCFLALRNKPFVDLYTNRVSSYHLLKSIGGFVKLLERE
ncbi:hypothetical protein HanRHA438_Chr02g0080511 [Helianthus annuus]|nr:hypothetical protein HanRHA438_Chr02g0080511 [Helianthus annuus]